MLGSGTHGIGNWIAAVFSWLLFVGVLVAGVQTINGRWAQWTIWYYDRFTPGRKRVMRILIGGMLTGLGVVMVIAIPIVLVVK